MNRFGIQFLLLAISLLLSGDPTRAQEASRISLQSSITRVQPMTGIVLWTDSDQVNTDAITLEYRYCGYNEVVRADGTYDFREINRILDEVAGRGHQTILRFRFVYPGKRTTVPEFIRSRADYQETVGTSEGRRTHFCDWGNQALQDFTLAFYTKFAQRYDTDRRLAFLQTGFGLWAEYHIYDGPRKLGKTFPDKAFQARFLKHLDKLFTHLPWSISVDAADSEYSPLEGNQDLLALTFGEFDDSFLCKQHPQENAVNWQTLGLDRWKKAPAGGEFSYYTRRDQRLALANGGPNGVSFTDAAKQFHITYMIGNDQPRFQTMQHIAAAGRVTGYRFRVTAAELNGSTLRLKVRNEGVAPIYRDAYFAVGKKRASESLRGLLPGQGNEYEIEHGMREEISLLRINCDAILAGQSIQFEADLEAER